ncbi:MAG: hypothetical protein IBX52_03020 [Bacterioplanes sp.]|nr:hypothetical protein [Bacterioplanes sp.]
MKWLLPVLACWSVQGYAHQIPQTQSGLNVDFSVVANWRSANVVDEYQFWQVPGTLMGGHAYPARQGVVVEEATLGLAYRFDANTYGVMALASHAGDGEHASVALEHAYVGVMCCQENGPWVAEIGQMSGMFSPRLARHAKDRWFADADLAHDVLFGRHLHDEGVRVWLHETKGWSVGLEGWRGKAFPATDHSNAGAWDVFARYQLQTTLWHALVGGWWYEASAQARADHRYGGGHQHTPIAPPGQTAPLFADVRYTGDTRLAGVYADLRFDALAHGRVGLELEMIDAELDGVVHDGIRQANLQATQQTLTVQPYWQWQAHTLAMRYEHIRTDNQLVGAAAPRLAQESGLANPEQITPRRYGIAWHWQWRDALALRTEWLRDESTERARNRVAVGVTWQYRATPHH